MILGRANGKKNENVVEGEREWIEGQNFWILGKNEVRVISIN
jgi:hypothetical protein